MASEQIVTNIVATSNFSSLIGDIQRTTASLATMQQQLSLTNRSLAAQAGQLQRGFGDTLRSTGQFATHFATVGSQVDAFGKNLDSGKLKLRDYYKTWQNHVKTSGGMIRDLARQQVALQQAIVQPLGRGADGLQKFNVHVAQGLNEITNKTAIARKEMQIYNKVIQSGGTQIINWGKNTQWAGRQLTVGLTVPIVAFGAAAGKAFKQADEALVRLTKVYGGLTATSSAELAKVRKDVSATAKELASAYGASFTETISLAADIAATGKQGNELLKTTQETTRLSILGEVDRQEAMKATLSLQNAFKMNTEELADSINFLNAVENQTSTSLADLVEAIPKAGTVIKGMGGGVKDLALYLTAMKEGGVNASEGANAIKSSLASLINPTKVAVDMFKGFGIDLGGIVSQNAGNLTGTILELQKALDQLDPLQKQKAIEQLFGKFQFARMNALFANLGKQGSQTLQVLDLMKASSQDLANIAGRELSQVTESASGKYKRALESLKADLAAAGEGFLKFGTLFLNAFDKVIKFFNDLPGPLKSFLSVIGGITALAGPIIMLTGVFANFFGYIVKGIGHLKALAKGGESFRLLTPEIVAADKAANLIEKSFYDDAKAAEVLQLALKNLVNEFNMLQERAALGAISVAPTLSTIHGNIIAAGGQRVVNPASPYLDPTGKRSSLHMNPVAGMTPQERQSQTIFSTVPGPGNVNRKIGANPQMYMQGDLPKISGVTAFNGVSSGIVAAEAAKWHSMTGALAMQSQAEITALKREVAATGSITASLSESYAALFPKINQVINGAAKEGALIVEELQLGKINADAANAKIVALNKTIEAQLAATTAAVATAQGRTAALGTVPLLNQPVVNPNTGKSNMKELFHKGSTANLLNKISSNLGVKTWGGRYSIETTMPRRLNGGGRVYDPARDGNVVPGDTSINYDNTPAVLEKDGYVLNQDASRKNPELVDIATGSQSSSPSGATAVDAILTPGETYFPPEVAKPIMPTLERANEGAVVEPHNRGGILGGRVVPTRSSYGAPFAGMVKSFAKLSGSRARLRYTEVPRFFYDTKTGANLTQQARAMLESHRLGRPIQKADGTFYSEQELNAIVAKPAAYKKEISGAWTGIDKSHAVPSIPVEGTTNYITPGVMVAHNRAGAGGNRALNQPANPKDVAASLEATAIHPMAIMSMAQKHLGYGSDPKTVLKAYDDLILGLKSRTTAFEPHGQGSFESFAASILKPHISSIQSHETASTLWKDLNSLGTIRGYNMEGGKLVKRSLGAVGDIQYAPTSNLERITANWPKKLANYKMGKQYNIMNTDPMHGPLRIGNAASISGDMTGEVGKSIYYSDKFGRVGIQKALPGGSPQDVAKYIVRRYMAGDKDIMGRMAYETANGLNSHPLSLQSLLKPVNKKFTGNMFRGITGKALEDSLPKEIANAIRVAKETGNVDNLIGREFILRRSSFSKESDVASYFKGGADGLVLNALVKNRNVTPISELFPNVKFQAPYGQKWGSELNGGLRSEQEALLGGKFRIKDFKNGVLHIETSGLEAREKGGPVNAGQPYIVGEKGPELFVPKNDGGIVSSYALGGLVSGNKANYGRVKYTGNKGVRGTAFSPNQLPYAPGLTMMEPMRNAMVPYKAGLMAAMDPLKQAVSMSIVKYRAGINLAAQQASGVITMIPQRITTSMQKASATLESSLNVFGTRMQTAAAKVKAGIASSTAGQAWSTQKQAYYAKHDSYWRSPFKGKGGNMESWKAGGQSSFGASMALGMAGSAVGGTKGMAMQVASMAVMMGILPKIAAGWKAIKAAEAGATIGARIFGVASKAALASGPLVVLLAMVAAVTLLIKFFQKLKAEHAQNVKENTLMVGMTEKGAKQAGIKYNDMSESIKNVNTQLELVRARGKASFESLNSAGVGGLTLTIKQLRDGIKAAKKDQKELVSGFSDVGGSFASKDDKQKLVTEMATNLKAQFVASGMSAQDATNKIFMMIKASKNADMAFSAISSKGFGEITDGASAATAMIEKLNSKMAETKAGANYGETVSAFTGKDLGNALSNTTAALDANLKSLIGTKDEQGKIIDEAKAYEIVMGKVAAMQGSNTKLTQEQVDSLKESHPELEKILNSTDTTASAFAKWRVLLSGVQVDLKNVTAAEAESMAKFEEALGSAITLQEQSGKGILGSSAKIITALQKQIAAGSQKAAISAQKTQQQIQEEMKLIDKKIKKIQEEAEARRRAIQEQQDAANADLELKKAQLEYQDAVSSGDMTAAANAKLKLDGIIKQQQAAAALKAINDKERKDVEAENRKKEKLQEQLDKNAKAVQAAQSAAATAQTRMSKVDLYQNSYEALIKRQANADLMTEGKAKTEEINSIRGELQNLASSVGKDVQGQDKALRDMLLTIFKGTLVDEKGNSLAGKVTPSTHPKGVATYKPGLADTALKTDTQAISKMAKEITGGQTLADVVRAINGQGALGGRTISTAIDLAATNPTAKYKLGGKEKLAFDTKEERARVVSENNLTEGQYFKYKGHTYRVKNASVGYEDVVRTNWRGGGLRKGQYSMVGEYGPEAIVASQDLKILNNYQTKNMLKNGPKFNIPEMLGNAAQGVFGALTGGAAGSNNFTYNTTFQITEKVDNIDEAMRKWDQHIRIREAKLGKPGTRRR